MLYTLFLVLEAGIEAPQLKLQALAYSHKSQHQLPQNKKKEKPQFLFPYSKPESNRHGHCCPQDFKSGVSTYSTIRATLTLGKTWQK